jgi:hypothetical protein
MYSYIQSSFFFLHACSLIVYHGMFCHQAGRGTRVGPFMAPGWTEAATQPHCIPLVGRPWSARRPLLGSGNGFTMDKRQMAGLSNNLGAEVQIGIDRYSRFM